MAQLQKATRTPTSETQPFWDGIKRRELILPRCNSCGCLHHGPRADCVDCSSRDMAWVRCSGRGRVDSYVIQHGQVGFSAGSPSTAVEILAVVAIDEGPRMLAILAGATPDGVRLDMPVEIVFEDVGDGPTLFKFKPA